MTDTMTTIATNGPRAIVTNDKPANHTPPASISLPPARSGPKIAKVCPLTPVGLRAAGAPARRAHYKHRPSSIIFPAKHKLSSRAEFLHRLQVYTHCAYHHQTPHYRAPSADDTAPDIGSNKSARFATCVGLKEQDSDVTIVVSPELIASLIVHPRPVRVDIDGLAYVLVLNPDGSATAGCQSITAKGCDQAFRALAAHLGYDIEE